MYHQPQITCIIDMEVGSLMIQRVIVGLSIVFLLVFCLKNYLFNADERRIEELIWQASTAASTLDAEICLALVEPAFRDSLGPELKRTFKPMKKLDVTVGNIKLKWIHKLGIHTYEIPATIRLAYKDAVDDVSIYGTFEVEFYNNRGHINEEQIDKWWIRSVKPVSLNGKDL